MEKGRGLKEACVCGCALGEDDILDGVPHEQVISEESSGEDEREEYSQAEGTASAKAGVYTVCLAFPRGHTRASAKSKRKRWGQRQGMRAAHEVASFLVHCLSMTGFVRAAS